MTGESLRRSIVLVLLILVAAFTIDGFINTGEARAIAKEASAKAEASEATWLKLKPILAAKRAELVAGVQRDSILLAAAEAENAALSSSASRAASRAEVLADSLRAAISPEDQPILDAHLKQDSIRFAAHDSIHAVDEGRINVLEAQITAKDEYTFELETVAIPALELTIEDYKIASQEWETVASPPFHVKLFKEAKWVGLGAVLCFALCR